jgi:hypothetical protein
MRFPTIVHSGAATFKPSYDFPPHADEAHAVSRRHSWMTASECLGIGSQVKKAETPKWLH